MRPSTTETSHQFFRATIRSLLATSLVLASGWPSLAYGEQQQRSSESGSETATVVATAIATANTSAHVEPGHSPLREVSYDFLAQNEAASETQPPSAQPPSAQQPPAKPATAPKLPAPVKPAPVKPAPVKPTPPATRNRTESAGPARPDNPPTTQPSRPGANSPFAPGPSRPLTPFSALQLPPGQKPFLGRLSRTPDVFGDTFIPVLVEINGISVFGNVDATIPLGSGTRRFKNEHSAALPTDRSFFYYNHFHNALSITADGQSSSENVDQFTFGVERTFGEGLWSFEVRMPFATEVDNNTGGATVQVDGIGNLVGNLKRLLYEDTTFATAIGLAVSTPTGSDAFVTNSTREQRVHLSNDSVHLLPYLAMQLTPDEYWFFHGYAQVDVAANPNRVTLINNLQTAPAIAATDSLIEQTFLFLDASAGYWWFRSNDENGLTGLASVVELHYSTTLNDAKAANLGTAFVGNSENRIDVVNLTTGVHTEWFRNTSVRVALVVPLDRDQRFFDAEAQISVIRRH